jgi:DNA-binding CsgD family transcriptional regulator/tetratricopeptide (TPR) repeat protein
VGEALAVEEPTGRVLADLAHHFAAAAPFGGSARAVEYNLRAARAATDGLAFEEAAALLRTAIELRIDDAAVRADAFLELGTACHRAGRALDALDAFRSAAAIARDLVEPRLLARAAVGYEDACWRPGFTDQGAVELLEEAAAALGEEQSALRVGLLSGLARALDFQGDDERGTVPRTAAITMARALGDRHALARVLVRSYWSRGTSLDRVLAMVTEARDIGAELGDTELRAEAMSWRAPALVALADLDAARAEAVALRETAEQTAQPFILHVAAQYESAIALSDGRLEDAEDAAKRSHEWSRHLTGRDASGVFGIQMFGIRREQGRLAELAPVTRILAGNAGRQGPWGPGLVALLAELEMEDEARRELGKLTARGLEPLRESLWLASLTYLADASAAIGSEETAALVYRELAPLTEKNVMIGHGVASYGAADRYLGMLAAVLGDSERAREHFERALVLNRRMGASTWFAHTAYEYARFLLQVSPVERARAEGLLGEAARLAERIGMVTLLARIRALGSPARLPDGLSPREVQVLGLVVRGLSNRDIGGELSISEHTAANHMRSILRKTGCSNRTEAASYAHRHGLAAPG